MLGGRSFDDWVAQYEQSHQYPINRTCHTIGIPMIAGSVLLFLAAPFARGLWRVALGLFVLGWGFQFVGHAYEQKPPEFLTDWRFLLVGLRWWIAKVSGRI
jgi:uncharacterized membrane protein YGL010W